MKKIKDPLYGYISIDDNLIYEVIDTPTFQRLRNIVQTSYEPLYATAVHNRFVHSLGVYHLSTIVSSAIKKSLSSNTEYISQDILEKFAIVFQYASLLHDVGHSPFSHTGEYLYLGSDGSRDSLHAQIQNLTNDSVILEEIKSENYTAAPHELMSVVVSLKQFANLFQNDSEKSFFARCILGYQYIQNLDNEKKILNCFISMLNSSVIDVDKLDYLIRDAYITGFDTVSIDYLRLLNSVEIHISNDRCELVYSKSGISVIENVVYAHDAERKWIQNHPVILYEAYLLQHAIGIINEKYNVFNYEALSTEGKRIEELSASVKLLSDSDILFLIKNIEDDSLVNEYLNRGLRRHPLWKSESEYKAVFNQGFGNPTYSTIEQAFDNLLKYLNSTGETSEINDKALSKLKSDIEENKKLLSASSSKEAYFSLQIKSKEKHLKFMECLKTFATKENIDFDFVVLKANQFNSGFAKMAFDDIKVKFSNLDVVTSFKEVTNTLSFVKSSRDKYYYIFYKRGDDSRVVNLNALAAELGKYAMDETYIN